MIWCDNDCTVDFSFATANGGLEFLYHWVETVHRAVIFLIAVVAGAVVVLYLRYNAGAVAHHLVGLESPLIIFRQVVFPAPFRPINP